MTRIAFDLWGNRKDGAPQGSWTSHPVRSDVLSSTPEAPDAAISPMQLAATTPRGATQSARAAADELYLPARGRSRHDTELGFASARQQASQAATAPRPNGYSRYHVSHQKGSYLN